MSRCLTRAAGSTEDPSKTESKGKEVGEEGGRLELLERWDCRNCCVWQSKLKL